MGHFLFQSIFYLLVILKIHRRNRGSQSVNRLKIFPSHCIYRRKHFKISLALQRDTAIAITSIKSETILPMYIKVTTCSLEAKIAKVSQQVGYSLY